MSEARARCPVCRSPSVEEWGALTFGRIFSVNCSRCGKFDISDEAKNVISRFSNLSRTQIANISGHIRANQGRVVFTKEISVLTALPTPSLADKATKLFRAISREYPRPGTSFLVNYWAMPKLLKRIETHEEEQYDPEPNFFKECDEQLFWLAEAWAADGDEIEYLIRQYLVETKGYLAKGFADGFLTITPNGWDFLQSLNEIDGQIKADEAFYLFYSPTGMPNESPAAVFYTVDGETVTKSLCKLLAREYSTVDGRPVFHCKAASSFSLEDQVLLDEVLNYVDLYDEPDAGVYDPPPSKELHLRAQFAVRARVLEDLVRRRTDTYSQTAAPAKRAVAVKPTANLTRTGTKRFKIALSFPGEHRSFVSQVADVLAARVGHECVLYDRYYEAEFARPDLDTYLQRLYHDESELVAVFLCADYERKEWCGLEWRAIRDLIKKRQSSAVMPLRFDNTEIPGLFSTDGYVWINNRPPQEVADLICQRMESAPSRLAPKGSENLKPESLAKSIINYSASDLLAEAQRLNSLPRFVVESPGGGGSSSGFDIHFPIKNLGSGAAVQIQAELVHDGTVLRAGDVREIPAGATCVY